MERKPRVLMFGPALDATSGISNVVNNWIHSEISEYIELEYVSTLDEYVSGNYLAKIKNAIRSYTFFLRNCLGHVDIVHIHLSHGMSFYRKLIIFIMAKFFRHKVVVHLHGSSFREFYDNGPKMQKSLVRWMFRKANAVFVLSKSWKQFVDELSSSHKENTYIIYNGAIISQFPNEKKISDEICIAFMGRLGKRKGTYDLLQAFARVRDEFPTARLVLGGDGEIEEVTSFVESENMKDRVSVLGWVTGVQKIEVFTQSDIYILPSYNEGLPGSILEAMAARTAIISTPVGGIPEAVIDGYNGYLVAPGDVDALCDRLRRLCSDRELRVRMGNRSYERIKEKFDMDKIVHTVIETYGLVLKN
jgi:glycosyltransferase involved in cell wall biosynthesis